MEWPSVEAIMRSIIKDRDALNLNNPRRTDFYLHYWEAHREIPWALLAHLVSRNAGYQMSDIARYLDMVQRLADPRHRHHWNYRVLNLDEFVTQSLLTVWNELSALFAFLEVGNFLIFRDVYPPLQAYSWAKLFPSHGNELFDALLAPRFGVDPYIAEKWKAFFAIVRPKLYTSEWETWSEDWSAGSAIQQHSFALVINEQHQIHDRVIHDKEQKYFPKFHVTTGPLGIIELGKRFGVETQLAFPTADPQQHQRTREVLIYTVGDFALINERIVTGRDTFAGLFVADAQRKNAVINWVRAHPRHHGTRWDYNSSDYSPAFDPQKVYSPALLRIDGVQASIGWPVKPGRQWPHLHIEPVKIPSINAWISAEQEALWLAPLTIPSPEKQLRSCSPDDLCEIKY